jgi:hypothetical protein
VLRSRVCTRTLPLRVSPRCAHVPVLARLSTVPRCRHLRYYRQKARSLSKAARLTHSSQTSQGSSGHLRQAQGEGSPARPLPPLSKKTGANYKSYPRLLFAQLLVKVRQERVQILLRCIHCPPVLSASPGAELNQGGITVLKQQQKSPQEATSCERRGSTHRRSTQGVHFERCLFCHAAALLILGDCEECGTSSALGTAPSGWQ